MEKRQRVVITISLPPDIGKEYRKIAKSKGESISQFFREIFDFYKQEKIKEEFLALRKYGVKKAKALKITEKEIENLIFEGR